MSSKRVKTQVFQNSKILHDAARRITKLNKLLPEIQKAIIVHDWLEKTINEEPEILASNIDENFESLVYASTQALADLNTIPDMSPYSSSDIIASGSAGTAVYNGYLLRNKEKFPSNIEIQLWSDEGIKRYELLEQNIKQSNVVRNRLEKLDSRLAELHSYAEKSTLSSVAGLEYSISSASVLRELLDQFKGFLLDKCRSGKGTTYLRISQNLSIDTPISRLAIETNQDVYDNLHKTLSEITHNRLVVEPNLMSSYFRQVEDHIKIITDNLDLSIIGINFNS